MGLSVTRYLSLILAATLNSPGCSHYTANKVVNVSEHSLTKKELETYRRTIMEDPKGSLPSLGHRLVTAYLLQSLNVSRRDQQP